MRPIIVTGGDGKFAKTLKNKNKNKKFKLKFLSKNELNILKLKSIENAILKYKPKILIHTAGLSRPMKLHDDKIKKSIDLNIIGTANIVKICSKYNVKVIYFSTVYVYDCVKGNFKETDAIKPINNYALSKMGGESSVLMYKNSLVLRIQMTEKPFLYDKAFTNLYSNFMFHEDMVPILPKIINEYGILNIGGKKQSVYNFAKLNNKKIKKIKLNKKFPLPSNQTMNLNKLNKILKN